MPQVDGLLVGCEGVDVSSSDDRTLSNGQTHLRAAFFNALHVAFVHSKQLPRCDWSEGRLEIEIFLFRVKELKTHSMPDDVVQDVHGLVEMRVSQQLKQVELRSSV